MYIYVTVECYIWHIPEADVSIAIFEEAIAFLAIWIPSAFHGLIANAVL